MPKFLMSLTKPLRKWYKYQHNHGIPANCLFKQILTVLISQKTFAVQRTSKQTPALVIQNFSHPRQTRQTQQEFSTKGPWFKYYQLRVTPYHGRWLFSVKQRILPKPKSEAHLKKSNDPNTNRSPEEVPTYNPQWPIPPVHRSSSTLV